ncbi:MAG: efflux RND transporter periplasmic adaptor subunit [Acidobacteria bacterium]|nr:efflux RND transporter periplasmic adaptor subunit [Acidobacteriota bacterium]
MGTVAVVILVAGCLPVATLLSTGCGSPHRHAQKQASAGTVPVVTRDVPVVVVATGTVGPQVGAEVKVGPRISGVLQRLYVRVGEEVKAGQVLAQLDSRELEAAVRSADADVRQAGADLESALARQRLEDARLKRRRTLLNAGMVSKEETQVQEEAAHLAAAEVSAAEAHLDQVKAALHQAHIQLGYARIFAPISGTVTSVATQEGETVAASFAVPTFLTIMDLSKLEVETYVDEVDIGKVKAGQRAEITVDAFPNETFDGRIAAVSPQARVRDNIVSYVVLVDLTSQNKRMLRPEMTASVRITAGERRGVLLVPGAAVQRDQAGNPFVLVQRAGQTMHRQVQLGEMFGNEIEVTNGLVSGDVVVTAAEAEERGSE